jgi:3-hydroxy-9,10-secoandrosta-1,3,5(10)-triene-9,17-dione monooxygenase reductase component
MAVDPAQYREAIGQFATGVAVVTCAGPDGPAGLTTNAVSSVSLDPLLLLVCFDERSRTLDAVRAAGRFAVNLLRAGQEDLARVFASKRIPAEKFEAVTHRIEHGVPVLDDALAWLACDVDALHPAGDHTIAVGAVSHVFSDPEGEPLLFFRGRWGALGAVPAPGGAAPDLAG